MLQNFINPSKMRILKQMLKKKYGYIPSITQWKGRIYISDPNSKSEPWEAYENEYDMYNELKNYQ